MRIVPIGLVATLAWGRWGRPVYGSTAPLLGLPTGKPSGRARGPRLVTVDSFYTGRARMKLLHPISAGARPIVSFGLGFFLIFHPAHCRLN